MAGKNAWRNRLIVGLIVFAAGFAAGFVVRDRQQHQKIVELTHRVEALGVEAARRTKGAAEEISKGTKGAAEELEGKGGTP